MGGLALASDRGIAEVVDGCRWTGNARGAGTRGLETSWLWVSGVVHWWCDEGE
jgi:hypothetical protein